MPVDHYENFPVASLLLPRRLRPAVEAIYRFARQADDIADEGDAIGADRLDDLAAYDAQLVRIASRAAPAPDPAGAMFDTLAATIRAHALPIEPFRDLLSAFSQDVTVTRYDDAATLLDYCRRSANPVGRLMLLLYGADDAARRTASDRICTALQLTNFWQDVANDRARGRVYLPKADCARFGVDDALLFGDGSALVASDRWKNLMRHEVGWARALMHDGAPLAAALPGRIGLELRIVVQGGLRILEKTERVDYDVFARRPTIGKADGPLLAWRALAMRARPNPAPTIDR